MRDNPYLIKRNNNLLAVQSIEDETTTVEYNSSTRTRYPNKQDKKICRTCEQSQEVIDKKLSR